MDLVTYQAQDGVARITLNRPEKRNALNAEMIAAVQDALRKSSQDEAVRVVLIAVAAMRGRALGGGAGIASACDLIVAAKSAWIGYPEVKIGFVPAMVAALVRRSVTEKRMFELLATGESLHAGDALAIGLINRVFPDADFDESVDAYLEGLVEKSPSALTLMKSLLYQTDGMTLEKAIEAGVQMNALSRTTEDAKKGFAGFLKK